MTSVTTARRTRTLVLGGAALALLTAACAGGATGSPAPTTSASAPASSSAPAPATAPPGATPAVSPTSVPAPNPPAGVPAGAGTATTVDLDGDGAPDTLWLAEVGGQRELGVVTTSHGGSAVEFSSADPQAATASAAVLASGAPVVFLDTGRSVHLYAYRVEGPGLVPVDGVTGGQYSFSLGFTGYGTGLTCEQQADGLHLFGENATADAAGTWTVQRTEVVVSAERSRATNGAVTTLGTALAQDDPRVQAAHGATCGDVADPARAEEPQ